METIGKSETLRSQEILRRRSLVTRTGAVCPYADVAFTLSLEAKPRFRL